MEKSINNLFCKECGSSTIEVRAWVDANTMEFHDTCNEDECWCSVCEELTEPVTLKRLWELFSDIPINNEDEIEKPFLKFPAGTPRFDVWHWFDERCPNSLAVDLMNL